MHGVNGPSFPVLLGIGILIIGSTFALIWLGAVYMSPKRKGQRIRARLAQQRLLDGPALALPLHDAQEEIPENVIYLDQAADWNDATRWARWTDIVLPDGPLLPPPDDPPADERVSESAKDVAAEAWALTMAMDADITPPPDLVPPRPVTCDPIRFSIGIVDGVERFHVLTHARWARKTGGGKTWNALRVLTQFIDQGVEVWYVNPKYLPVDKSGIHVHEVVDRCDRIAIDLDGIESLTLLRDAADVVRDRVIESRAHPGTIFRPMVVFVDEANVVQSNWVELDESKILKGAEDDGKRYLGRIIRLGREVDVFLMLAGQDAQVQNGPMNNGTASNFTVQVFHPSLDDQSLLNILGGARRTKNLPVLNGPYDWLLLEVNPLGEDAVKVITFPPISNAWIMERLAHIPLVERGTVEPVEATRDSPVNRDETVVLDMLELFQATARAVTEPVPERMEPTESDEAKARAYLADHPTCSARALARHLWNKDQGNWNKRAKRLKERITHANYSPRSAQAGAGDPGTPVADAGGYAGTRATADARSARRRPWQRPERRHTRRPDRARRLRWAGHS